MAGNSTKSIKRALEPVERISEFLFGLTTVLTLTTTFDATGFDRGNVHKMLLAALGWSYRFSKRGVLIAIVPSIPA